MKVFRSVYGNHKNKEITEKKFHDENEQLQIIIDLYKFVFELNYLFNLSYSIHI